MKKRENPSTSDCKRLLLDINGVVRVRSVRSLGEEESAGKTADDQRDDPSDYGLQDDGAVQAAGTLQ